MLVCGRVAALVVSFAVAGCIPTARWYEPVSPLSATVPAAGLKATSVSRVAALTVVNATIQPSADVAFGRPRLTTPEQPGCASGESADGWNTGLTNDLTHLDARTHGNLMAAFGNASLDRYGLLLVRPTVLDVPVATFSANGPGASYCLRLPLLIQGGDTVEWRQEPGWWIGMELRVDAPVHRVAGVGATVIAPVSVGAFAGPVRLGLEFGVGFGFGPRNPRTGAESAGVLEVGARVDSPLLVIRRFATGLELGYTLQAWTFGTDPTTNQPVDSTIHGPRAALRFLLLPPVPPSPKYDARADAWSTGIEFSTSLLYVIGNDTPTPTFGGSIFGDIGW